MATIEERIEELLSKDITSLSPDEIISIVTGENTPSVYVDPQSDEGFNKEASLVSKDVDDLIKSLEPKDPPIPISEIENLSCDLYGDELYSEVLLRSLKVKDKNLYDELLNSSEFLNDKEIGIGDIGVSTGIASLNKKDKSSNGSSNKKSRSSNGITDFLNKKNPSLLEGINESLFDKIDPFIFGKPTNSGSRKKRELNILGFKVPLEFITANGKILHVKISGPNITIKQAEERVKKYVKDQNKNVKSCDTGDDKDKNKDDKDNKNQKVSVGGLVPVDSDLEKYEEYDLKFYVDPNTGKYNEDPILLNDDCEIFPEDPITGDPIVTKESIEGILDEFCDPPESDLSGLETGEGSDINTKEEKDDEEAKVDPDFEEKQIKEAEGCLDSTIIKYEKIDKKNLELARWKNIEKYLEEINYHYEIVWEYQKTLYDEWISRLPDEDIKTGDNLKLGLAISILTYNDIIRETEREIFFLTEDYNSYKKVFLDNNKIFSDNLFLFSIPDTELIYDDLKLLFEEKIAQELSPINYDDDKKSFPIDDSIDIFLSLVEDIRYIIIKKNQIFLLNKKIEENIELRDIDIQSLENELLIKINIEDLEEGFKDSSNWIYSSTYTLEREYAEEIFKSASSVGASYNPYKSDGYQFVNLMKKFSVRFSNIEFDNENLELQLKLNLFTDLGNPLQYKSKQKPNKITLKGTPQPIFKTVSEPDIERIKVGNEYAGNGGLLVQYPKDYFKGNKFLTISNLKEGQKDIAEFYDFLTDIISTGKNKNTIINEIKLKRGILYAELIEKSASNWLFFTPEERGDNDARNPSNLRPASYNAEGEPTPAFVDFWSKYKIKWNAKYVQEKNLYIKPEMDRIKVEAQKAGLAMGKTLNIDAIRGVRIIENYFDLQKKYEQIQELLLVAAQKIQEIEEELKPENIEKEFASISCGSGSSSATQTINCPPTCCGPAGSDFKTDNFLLSAPPGSDCPSIFSKCWMKEFTKHLTLVGLLPYPNGLPPIENTAFFLGGGPSVRLGLKYWPVGYLPPAFIPLPVPNPIDGQPYIRIPLPMIWTIIEPIVIPLPLNLGTLIIFIPFIGGFMPTPLFFVKENVNGTSFFLTGLRGPRFIPRKSDPKINDPLEKMKQAISFGFPDKLVPLPGMGSDNIDSLPRILEDIRSNLTKIIDNIKPPGNLDALRKVQEKELSIKNSISSKVKEYNKKFALLDDPEPDLSGEKNQLDAIIAERKSVLSDLISDYIKKGIPNPKTINFPKDKDNLKIDIPGKVKSIIDLAQQKASLVPVIPIPTIDVKDYFKDVLKTVNIPTPSKYDTENENVSNNNRIILKINVDPRVMNENEFKDFAKKIKEPCIELTKYMLSGNGASVIKEKRNGAFSSLEMTKFQGVFAFPDPTVLDPPTQGLEFSKIPNPLVDQVTNVLTNGISSASFKPSDFTKYVRSDENGNPLTVIRVKDIKKIVSSKIGLSKKKAGEAERPMDKIDALVTNFPFPSGPLASSQALSQSFGTAISLFEIPTAFPVKQDQISQTPLAGGIIQIAIPGAVIKQFISKFVDEALKNTDILEKYIPEIADVNSPKFTDLEPNDIQKIVRSMIEEALDPNSLSIPDFLKLVQIPILPKSRPTDILEQILIGLGVPPPARIVYSLIWKYFKGLPKSPLPEEVTKPIFDAAAKILTKIPWPVAVLLGRNVVNIINPIALSDDLPSWRRMSLKNVYYVVYLDEFLRSAADVSGLFKFFFGDPVYPIPELPSELQKAFNIKKY